MALNDLGIRLSDKFCGIHRIVGTVDRLGLVGSYDVFLLWRKSLLGVRKTTSAADGTYLFENILYSPQAYIAVALDNNATPLNAAIADLITPEPMP